MPEMPAESTLFLNRNSGARENAGDLAEAARALGIEVVEVTEATNCSREITARRRRGQRLFIAAGGDGTVHHVVQSLVGTDSVLGVIPSGTYNHFARDLGIPLGWREALEVALHGTDREIDAARVNDRFFVNNISLGLYPELVARREERGREYPRWKARLYAFAATLRRYRHVTLIVETEAVQEVIRTHVFLISNNSYDLERVGLEAPRSTLTDGSLSIYWLEHTSRLRLTRILGRYLAGRLRQIPDFRSFRSERVRVQSSHGHLRIGIDGELFTLSTPLVVSSVPRSLTVRVPQNAMADADLQ